MPSETELALLEAENAYRRAKGMLDFLYESAKQALVDDKPLPPAWTSDHDRRREESASALATFIQVARTHFGEAVVEPFIVEPWFYRIEETIDGKLWLADEFNLALVPTTRRFEKIPGRVVLCGVGYRVIVAEEMVVFTEDQPIFGCQTRFSFRRKGMCWYVSIEGQQEEVMASHILRAAEIVCDNFGGSFKGKRGEYHL